MSQNLASVVPDYSDSGGSGGGGVNSVSAGTGITVTGTPTDPIINSVGSVPRPSTTIYVSPSGDDATANGSLALPFLTIQGAINFRNTLSNTANIEIFIFGGNYVENLTITVPNTYFTCNPAPYSNIKTVLITGTVTVSISVLTGQGSGEVAFTNIGWLSTGITTGSTVAQGLNMSFYNCSILGWALHNQDSPTTYTVRYQECILQHNGTEALVISVGCVLTIMRCELFHTNPTTNPVVNIQNGGGGSGGILNIQYTTIRTNTTSATAMPLIRFQNTSNSNNNIMLHNSFYYTSSTVDTSPTLDKCCVQFNQTGQMNFEAVAYNFMEADGARFGAGTPPGTNRYQVIQQRNTGGVNLGTFSANYGGNASRWIAPGITTSIGGLIAIA
jgi:hypothetical protein